MKTCRYCYDKTKAKWETENPGKTFPYPIDGNDNFLSDDQVLRFRCQVPVYTANGYGSPRMMIYNHFTDQFEFLEMPTYLKMKEDGTLPNGEI